jgi:hypothetical protein
LERCVGEGRIGVGEVGSIGFLFPGLQLDTPIRKELT